MRPLNEFLNGYLETKMLSFFKALRVFKCPFPCQYVQNRQKYNNTQHTLKSDLGQ